MNELLAKEFADCCDASRKAHRDICEHMKTLSDAAAKCRVIVEFGVRTGNSTCALLHGLESANGGVLHSYDYQRHEFACPPLEKTEWDFNEQNTQKLVDIPECDLLFIDTLHTADQVRAELRHANRSLKWIYMHDTMTWGVNGELGQPGILGPIFDFLADNPHWRVLRHWTNCNGLLALERR